MMLDDTSKTSERRLIENIVECKDPVFGDYNYNGTTGLIENIVECKVFHAGNDIPCKRRLIENIVECKDNKSRIFH